MAGSKKLVIGASGFTGSHVTRLLVERGEDVRVMIRTTSSTRAIDDVDVDRMYGDIFNDEALREAMAGCDVGYYCVVDARSWLQNPAPLFRTNVDGLRHVLDAAVAADLGRFVFLSTIGTLAIRHDAAVTEDDEFNWPELGGGYIASRVEAEHLVLRYVLDAGLPAVVLCVSVTFGPRDWAPTPHGAMLDAVAHGRMPFYVEGAGWEVVGIEDAARALILAGERGRVGERYIVSDRFMTAHDLFVVAADAGGVRPPRLAVPLRVMYAAGRAGDVAARLLRRDLVLTTPSVRLMHTMTPLDHSKAERELGWRPTPTEDSIRDAIAFYAQRTPPTGRRSR